MIKALSSVSVHCFMTVTLVLESDSRKSPPKIVNLPFNMSTSHEVRGSEGLKSFEVEHYLSCLSQYVCNT